MIQMNILILLCAVITVNAMEENYNRDNRFGDPNYTGGLQIEKTEEDKAVRNMVKCYIFLQVPLVFTNWIMPAFLDLRKGLIMAIVHFWLNGFMWMPVSLPMFITNLVLYSNQKAIENGGESGEMQPYFAELQAMMSGEFESHYEKLSKGLIIGMPIFLDCVRSFETFFELHLVSEKAIKLREVSTQRYALEALANYIIPAFLQPPLFWPMFVFGCLQSKMLHGSSIVLLLIANITLLAVFKPVIVDFQLQVMGIFYGIIVFLSLCCCKKNN